MIILFLCVANSSFPVEAIVMKYQLDRLCLWYFRPQQKQEIPETLRLLLARRFPPLQFCRHKAFRRVVLRLGFLSNRYAVAQTSYGLDVQTGG